ncbi:MAG: IBR domain-containing protein [Nitrospiraceae bacterium]|nr:IBR domain-containing protein [Nitrospiraceae bacterium]
MTRICPTPNCGAVVVPDNIRFPDGFDERKGLIHVRCPRCTSGGVVAPDGPQLVFRLAYQYVFAFGAASDSVTVLVTLNTQRLFAWAGFAPELLARHAAEWIMLRGRGEKVIALALDQPQFPDFFEYVRMHLVTNPMPAGPLPNRPVH